MRKFFILLVLLFGCNNQKQQFTRQENQINLYPGYVAKSKGRILWFPEQPKFSTKSGEWIGTNSTEVTSCVFDPWPSTPGNQESLIKISN